MKLYIKGTLSNPQTTFIPQDLWFSNDSCDDNTLVSENCVCLSGIECESSLSEEGKSFSCRWKGVEFTDENDMPTETFSIIQFMETIKSKAMRLSNMSACFDTDVDVHITSVGIVQQDPTHDIEIALDSSMFDDINFIAD